MASVPPPTFLGVTVPVLRKLKLNPPLKIHPHLIAEIIEKSIQSGDALC
jgi:hypothetical protein